MAMFPFFLELSWQIGGWSYLPPLPDTSGAYHKTGVQHQNGMKRLC
jgi:hypothetical protein